MYESDEIQPVLIEMGGCVDKFNKLGDHWGV